MKFLLASLSLCYSHIVHCLWFLISIFIYVFSAAVRFDIFHSIRATVPIILTLITRHGLLTFALITACTSYHGPTICQRALLSAGTFS